MLDNNTPVDFYFRLTLVGAETLFQEVSGLNVEIETEVVEGGENGFVHRLPVRPKYSNLILKRGVDASSSALVKWCQEPLDNGLFQPKELLVSLMNEQNTPVMIWLIEGATPFKWSIDPINSTNNEVAIVAIEFKYSFFKQLN